SGSSGAAAFATRPASRRSRRSAHERPRSACCRASTSRAAYAATWSRARRMERMHADAELLGIAADVVQRDEAVEAIERGILDALRGDWRGELLEAHREIAHGVVRRIRRAEQRAMQEVEDARIADPAVRAGMGDRPVDVTTVLRRGAVCIDVRPIDREAR